MPVISKKINHAVSLIETICSMPQNQGTVKAKRLAGKRSGLPKILQQKDTSAFFDYLIPSLSFQGISDRVALGYLEEHGCPTWEMIEHFLSVNRSACPKLGSVDTYRGCRYRKAARTCAKPHHLRYCPVRKIPHRNGLLSIQAYSLYYFLRDTCQGDFGGWIDQQIAAAKTSAGTENWDPLARRLLIEGLSTVDGIASKLANMVLTDLLIGGRPKDEDWFALGTRMITIDSLVHKMFERTGILTAFKQPHAYGPECYGPKGCEAILRRVAGMMEEANTLPSAEANAMSVQKAIWRFCAADQLSLCNAASVGKGSKCQNLIVCGASKYCAMAGRS